MRIFYLLLFLVPSVLLAQQQGWQALTISDGLSQGMIYDIRQDQKGFVWIATKDGLNRYDGYNFTVFTHDPYNPFSLSDSNCSALLIDRRGRLWVGTLNQGLNLFDTKTRRFYHIDIRDQDLPNAGNYEVRFLAEDPDGNIWVDTDKNKLFRITLPEALKNDFPKQADFTAQTRISRVVLPDMPSNKTAFHVQFEPDGQAMVGTTYGRYAFNWRQAAGARRLPQLSTHDKTLTEDDDARANYWFSTTRDSVHTWVDGVHRAIAIQSQNSTVTLKFIDNNTVAIATTRYLWLMSPRELLAQTSLTARNAFTELPPNLYAVRKIMQDQTGAIWIGTAGYGIRTFNPKTKQFKAYLPNTSLSHIMQDRQQQTYSSQVGRYYQLDRTTNRSRIFLDKKLTGTGKQHRFLMQDRQGFFWLSYFDVSVRQHFLTKFSDDWKLIKNYPMPAQITLGIYGNQIVEDKTGQLWVGATNGGLLRFNPATEVFTVFSYGHLLPQSGAEIETFALYFDKSGTLWIGTQKGMIRAGNPLATPVFTLYKNSTTNRESLSNDFVSSMLDDPNQPDRYLWVSTKGGGLERLDKQTNRFRHFTEAQGLPNKVVYGILADEFNNLWMSTNRGLAQFNPKTLVFHNYTKADGLQDDEFNTGSFFKSASGELLFGGVNGLTFFRAGEVASKTGPVPQAHIIGLKVNNEPIPVGGADGILSRSIDNTDQIRLAYNQNLVTLEFGLMDYTNTAKNRYRYRLEGIDEDWVEAGTNRFANYAQLPAGNYTLQMEGSADGDVWSKPVELRIQVVPPFYRSWWAYLLYALAVAVAGWQLYRFQKQRWRLQQQVHFEHKEASRLAELDALKTQFFANISHEFRTPLTLILGPIEQAVQEYAHDARFPLIQRNANRLLSLINQLLDLSKLEAGQLQPEPERGDLAAFLSMLASSFSSLAQSRQITFAFAQNESKFTTDFDRDKLEKVVTNLLANAFKFTPAGHEVRLTVQYPEAGSSEKLRLTVADTGIGIAPDHVDHIFERFYQVEGQTNRPYEGTGIGLALVHELVKVLGGTIHVASTEGVGTTFTVTLPIEAVHPSALVSEVDGASTIAVNPIAISDPAAASWQVRVPDVPVGSDGAIMLIIDDNADIRAYVRSVFQADYQIVEAVDGQDGLEQATALLPNIVICDLMMPRLDGFGFCKALKTQAATSHIPVVMLTAKATVADRIEGFELGADDYLTKPFNRAEIQARVRNLIQQRERLYQRFALPTGPVPTDQSPLADATGPAKPALLVAEQKFLDRLSAVVLQQLDNTDFSIEMLAEAVNLSRTQLHRKLKAIANTTATNFVRDIRLSKAADLLATGEETVSQVAFAVGFDSLSYFAKVFQEHYGVLPSQYGRKSAGTTD